LQEVYYRARELTRCSDRKEEGFDSVNFCGFVNAIAAIAAFNGHLHLRKLFLKEYTLIQDSESKEKHKQIKKQVFGRPWMNGQIQRLRAIFKRIANEGSFKNEAGGSLSKASRYNLNLCMFYVALVTLRYLGVRQQCIRKCMVGKNIIFGPSMSMTFQWTDKETKNARGVRHEFSMKQHREVQENLIEAVYIYYKKIYPYISGSQRDEQSPGFHEKRRKAIAGQFFLKCARSGICKPFEDDKDFYWWFCDKASSYLDFEEQTGTNALPFNPHFLRAMYGDWLRYDLKYSSEQTAFMAGDSERTFESEYISHPLIYDATDAWSEKSEEMRAKQKRDQESNEKGKAGMAIKRVESEVEKISQRITEMSDNIKHLTKGDKNGDTDEDQCTTIQ
jgi:hypothetical protein